VSNDCILLDIHEHEGGSAPMEQVKNKVWKWFSLLPLSLLFFLSGCSENMVVLNPQGPVAKSEYKLIVCGDSHSLS
jgi:hypothetical protein